MAPLDANGHIDPELWRKYRPHCGVRRFWGTDEEIGRLVHKPGGAEHARWIFDYDETAEDDDEAGDRFGNHIFRNGEYVSIRDEDGELHTFQWSRSSRRPNAFHTRSLSQRLLTLDAGRPNDFAATIHSMEDSVLVDHRTYRIKPGMTQAHLDIYEKYGLAAQSRHLGAPIAYMYAESGEVNSIVHQWAYEDAADRTRRRANMWGDPEWLVYIQKLNESGYLVEQKNSLMIPTKFCPIKR